MRESRNRWRALVALGADIAFETDRDGRFVMLYPETVLGWQAARLIGTPARRPCWRSRPPEPPVRPAGRQRRCSIPFNGRLAPAASGRVWLRHADGTAACLLLSSEPIADPAGGVRGHRHRHHGAGSPRCAAGLGSAAAGECVAHPGAHARCVAARAVAGPGTRGAGRGRRWPRARRCSCWRHRTRCCLAQQARMPGAANPVSPGPATRAGPGARTWARHFPRWANAPAVAGWFTLAWHGTVASARCCWKPPPMCPTSAAVEPDRSRNPDCRCCCARKSDRFGATAVLALWREAPGLERRRDRSRPGSPAGHPANDRGRSRSSARSARQSRCRPAHRPAQPARLRDRSCARRFDRLDRDGLYGTLLVVGLDGLRRLNAEGGRLRRATPPWSPPAAALNNGVRPTDVTARLSGDLFALWLDGADHFAAAERAEVLARSGVLLAARNDGARAGKGPERNRA